MKIKFFEAMPSSGFPSQADDYVELPLDLNEWIVKRPATTFFMQVEGDSMEPKIPSGSLLVVDRSLKPKNHDIIVALLQGKFVVKRVEFEGGKIHLIADHSRELPIDVLATSDFQVWGVVTYVIHRTR